MLLDPPSELVLFRDITLFASAFCKKNILLESRPEDVDFYHKYLKSRGAFDFVEDFVGYRSEYGQSIRSKYNKFGGNILIRSFGYHNFSKIITAIR
jgi:hypothetical protein